MNSISSLIRSAQWERIMLVDGAVVHEHNLRKDGVHLNIQGHISLSIRIKKTILAHYNYWKTEQGKNPFS